MVHGPPVRWLCVATVAAGGLACLGVAYLLVAAEEEVAGRPAGGVAVWSLTAAGMLQLVLAGWGVWSWGYAEGAG